MEAQGHFPPSCKYLSCGMGEPSQKAIDTSIQETESLKICPHQQCAGTGHFQQQQRNQLSHSWQNMTEVLDGAAPPSSLVLLLSMKERAWTFRNKSFCFSASDFMAQVRRCLKGLSNNLMFPFNSIFLNMAKQVVVHVSVIRIRSYKAVQHLNSWMKSWLHLFTKAFLFTSTGWELHSYYLPETTERHYLHSWLQEAFTELFNGIWGLLPHERDSSWFLTW